MASLSTAILALVLGIWRMLDAHSPEAGAIASAIATAVVEDGKHAPVFQSHAEDAVVLAQIVFEESAVQTDPRPYSWDSKGGVSCGAFQLPCATLPQTLVGQARKALWLLHRGREVCPQSPASPYLGGCLTGPARKIGDRRAAKARALLSAWVAPGEE